ncbi:hypothetical protein C5167_018882 [Papaver somniferum]|uniref:Small ribosomal subunit protein uS15 N-terminal domain-containing protein n=1 Tax=Papaver somniferum TaxID=3469 RepID=A0A4Y7IQP6_PAPSO|nr:hypothetical protein C5167_018891 [Papaver somniferum]RZC50462.1 hypothetical protein C5167_018882 [Papaver somniferum]
MSNFRKDSAEDCSLDLQPVLTVRIWVNTEEHHQAGWNFSSPDVEDNTCKFAKNWLTPSQIDVILRDSHGLRVLHILKAHGLNALKVELFDCVAPLNEE